MALDELRPNRQTQLVPLAAPATGLPHDEGPSLDDSPFGLVLESELRAVRDAEKSAALRGGAEEALNHGVPPRLGCLEAAFLNTTERRPP